MNADLERELRESPEFGPVVARLRAARDVEVRRETEDVRKFLVSRAFRLSSSLLAASALAALALVSWLPSSPVRQDDPAGRTVPYGAREYRLTPDEMIATQNPDGSWQNDFLTCRNAAALQGSGKQAAQIAYKKAVRYLRAKGLSPHRS